MAEQTRAYADPAQGIAAEKLAEEKKPAPDMHDLPLRQYLDTYVVPSLLPGMNAVAEERPENPVEWLAYWLLKNNPGQNKASPGGGPAGAAAEGGAAAKEGGAAAEAEGKPEMQSSQSDSDTARGGLQMGRSHDAVADNIKESDLLFIEYARTIFERFDKDDSNHVCPREVRMALTFFNIYLSIKQTAKVICMFLRDSGETTPMDEMEVELTFSRFCSLLLDIDKYMLTQRRRDCTFDSLRGRFQAMTPSKRCDVLARVLFPVLIALQLIAYRLILPLY